MNQPQMKQTKPYLLLIVSVLLVMSIGLLSASIYMYMKYPPNASASKPISNNLPKVNHLNATRDSLQKVYQATVKDLETEIQTTGAIGADSVTHRPEFDSTNFNRLQQDINTILVKDGNQVELDLVQAKIGELQSKLDMLRTINQNILKENFKLTALVKKLSAKQNTATQTVNSNKVTGAQFATNTQNFGTSNLVANQLQVMAFTRNDFLDKETNNAAEAEKIAGHFVVKNPSNNAITNEIMVVILQPNGRVLQNSTWETGIFYTKEGKQLYSNKLRFDQQAGETKKLQFAISADKFLPGKYQVQLYHNGVMIGKTTKNLQ
ncbi:MAG: hypothetical protein RLY16_2649 [Bacteroidota bacterium]|jgi:hypothetical protein